MDSTLRRLRAGRIFIIVLCVKAVASPTRVQRTTPRRAQAFSVDGITVTDAGGVARPNVESFAGCCQPLAHAWPPGTSLRLVAGLPYRLRLRAQAGTLQATASRARLRLVRGVPEDDADCADNAAVSDFGHAFSAVDGRTPALEASAVENIWAEARFPFNGTFGVCYWGVEDSASDSGGGNMASDPQRWRAIQTAAFFAYGSPRVVPSGFWCVAAPHTACVLRVPLPDPASRLRLVEPDDTCGAEGSQPAPRPFNHETSIPTLEGGEALHSMGQYLPLAPFAHTYRVCMCNDFEYDVNADGFGPCRSSGAQDFPQSLGLLYVTVTATSPAVVYPGVSFDLNLHCGSPAWPGCATSTEARLRLVERTAGTPSMNDSLCQVAPETALYLEPQNCEGTALACRLAPSVISASHPRWHGLVLREAVAHRVPQPYELDVCFCDGVSFGSETCADARAWHRMGTVPVRPLQLLPNPLVTGARTDLELLGASGAASSSPMLKLLHDPQGRFNSSSCASEPQTAGTLFNLRCGSARACQAPSGSMLGGHKWAGVEVRKAGYYTVCYCDFGCEVPEHWRFVSWHLAAGPTSFFVGSPTQGAQVYVGSPFELTALGEGLSVGDRLLLLRGDTSGCDTPAAATERGVAVVASAAPTVTSSLLPGTVSSLQPAVTLDGRDAIRMITAVAHDLRTGDRVRFKNVTTTIGSTVCPRFDFVASLDGTVSESHCVQALVAHSVEVLSVASSIEALLDVVLSADECEALDLTKAEWAVTSRETFKDLAFPRGSQGIYRVCWGREPLSAADYGALAGMLDVREATPALAAVHLTSVAPGIDAPSILAFQTGNAHAYADAAGPMGLKISFRNVTRFRHAFRSEAFGMPSRVERGAARQSVCGLLFRELWSDSEDGFPQPQGCFYDEGQSEYGMIFPPRAGLSAGRRYQVVMETRLSGSLVSEHDWIVVPFANPFPSLAPEEIQRTAPDTFGDIGEVANELSCKEACTQSPLCNVAVFNVNVDNHCFLADFSRREDPYATIASTAGRADLTMFMADRLNKTHPHMIASADTGSSDTVVDVWSMDDIFARPFGVVEAGEAKASGTAGLAPASADPRWHLLDGLKVVAPPNAASFADDAPLELSHEEPELYIRLRAAPGSPIEPGSLVRLFLAPLTQWALPIGCVVECEPHSVLMKCGRCDCVATPLVTSPWRGSRNSLRLELPSDMDSITDAVMHKLHFSSRYLPLPTGGFLPVRLAAELSPPGSTASVQPRADYAVSTGARPYAAVSAAVAVLALDGNERPFAADASNALFARIRLGARLSAPGGGDATTSLTVRLPTGYVCKEVGPAPADLRTLEAVAASATGGVEARGEVGPSGGHWTYSGNDCTYHLDPHAIVYSGSTLVLRFVVDNPSTPMTSVDGTNAWNVLLTGPGDSLAEPLTLVARALDSSRGDTAETMLAGTSGANEDGPLSQVLENAAAFEAPLFAKNAAVLGHLTETFLTPSDSWWGSARDMARVFFRMAQSSGEQPLVLLLEAPPGFGFKARCHVDDLPAQYYRPLQGLYASETHRVRPLGVERRCRGLRGVAPRGEHFRVAEVVTSSPAAPDASYGFSVLVLHPYSFDLDASGAENSFTLTTFAGSVTRPLDRSTSMPLFETKYGEMQPHRGLFWWRGYDGMLQASVANMLPYAHTKLPSRVVVLLRMPSAIAGADLGNAPLSWRLFAPVTYSWDFNDQTFHYRQSDVPGASADLPIVTPPKAPRSNPRNRLTFRSEDAMAWTSGEIYGFAALLRVPTETPRHSVNEWLVEFGYDQPELHKRIVAFRCPAAEVRTIHSFYVRSLLTELKGGNNELLFQFATLTAIPAEQGALVIEAPINFVFEAACVPVAPKGQYQLYAPVRARLDCSARGTVALRVAGLTRPKVTIIPLDLSIPPGYWAFLLACINPSSTAATEAGANTFVLSTYADKGAGVVADVSAFAQGFAVLEELPLAELVSVVDYRVSGRDDHPGQGSNLVLAFELRAPSSSTSGGGNVALNVQAPEGFEFYEQCHADIGSVVFGLGQPYPSPYVAFEDGVRLLSCVGYAQFAHIELTPGLLPGRRYAFMLRIDQQPSTTPALNVWRLNVGTEGSLPILGYKLWAFDSMALSMSSTSRVNLEAPVESIVAITFVPANTMTMKGMLVVVAPEGYKIRLNCNIKVVRLVGDDLEAETVPNPVCLGEQPPVNKAQVRFQSELAVVTEGSTYRMSLEVTNPSFVPSHAGKWTLQSYAEATSDPQWSILLDIGYVDSVPITNFFSAFVVRLSEGIPNSASQLTLDFDVALPHALSAGDVVMLSGPPGYSFGAAVADPALENDFRSCIAFERVGVGPQLKLPEPECAGQDIRFRFKEAHLANELFRFRAVTRWPLLTLSSFASAFTARHDRGGTEQTQPVATGLAYLAPVIPRLVGFTFAQVGPRAEAISSRGDVRFSFAASQAASAVLISSRVDAEVLAEGVSFADTVVEVHAMDQLLKKVLTVHDGDWRLVLALQVDVGIMYTFTLRGVKNPDVVGMVLWSVKTYARRATQNSAASTSSNGDQAVDPHLYDPVEVRLWINGDAGLRDEMVDWVAGRSLGQITMPTDGGVVLGNGFFDYLDTDISFTISLMPMDAPAGYRLLIFAPPEWWFINGSFAGGDKFPAYADIGPLFCVDTTESRSVFVYAARLLAPIPASAPCRLNPSQICVNKVAFSLHASTPPTPADLPRWRRERDQAWLLEIDAYAGDDCGPGSAHGVLDHSLVRFTNDALFQGFDLKESLDRMVVFPEPHGQLSRQRVSVEVEFETRTELSVGAESDAALPPHKWGIFLRLSAVLGLDFEPGCLAAMPDPDYADCVGQGKLAVMAVRERRFAGGRHRMVLLARNPARTPSSNWWTLETFVGVSVDEAIQGPLELVRQRQRAAGYDIMQHLAVALTPSTTQRGSSVVIYIWIRPHVYVEPLGSVEIHAAQAFEIGCKGFFPMSMPPGPCRSYMATSGEQLHDIHHVVELELLAGVALLPDREYEMAVRGLNPAVVVPGLQMHWGVRLRGAMREVLEANMEVPPFELTDTGLTPVSLSPSTSAAYALNQVRLLVGFSKDLQLDTISEVRIMAAMGWQLTMSSGQPSASDSSPAAVMCLYFQDVTGGPDARNLQLPYSQERGHHKCPQPRILLLLLSQSEVIKASVYTLLIGARNAGSAPTQNFWSVSLLTPATNLGWNPDPEKNVGLYRDGLLAGQRIVATTELLGFHIGSPMGDRTPPPLPLPGDFFEVISSGAVSRVPGPCTCIIVALVLFFCNHKT